jgi:hypothetical protein
MTPASLPRADAWVAVLLSAALSVFWAVSLWPAAAGWDESMHVQLPATRMLLALEQGELREACDALLSCSQYPFAWPAALALLQLVTGLSEHACRVLTTVAWCATILGVFLLAREVVIALRTTRSPRAFDRLAPFLAMLLAALCPLALAYSGTLFLEVPAALAAVWTLRAWLVFLRTRRTRAAIVAGLWITAAVFVKFNYGAMLLAAIALDAAFQLARAGGWRAKRRFLGELTWMGVVPLVVLLWWFVLPLPGDAAVAAEHRSACIEFLLGNQRFSRTPDAWRVAFACNAFSCTPRMLLVHLVGVVAAFFAVRDPSTRILKLVLATTLVPIALHPFHLDRFQIVIGPAWWTLAGLGLAHLITDRRRLVLLAGALVLALVAPDVDRLRVARWAGLLSDEPGALRSYQEAQQRASRCLSGARRPPTGGLHAHEFRELSSWIHGAVRPDERVAWIGIPSQFSPYCLELAVERSSSDRARFLAELARRPVDVTYFGVDPSWSDGQLSDWASGFDVVLFTNPIDIKDHASRRFLTRYAERLQALGWTARPSGSVSIARALDSISVDLHTCRRRE